MINTKEAEGRIFPGVTLEEAETIATLLGYDADIKCHMSIRGDRSLSDSEVDSYIELLLGSMFGEYVEHYAGLTWQDCPNEAAEFYYRASAVEVR